LYIEGERGFYKLAMC